MSAPDISLRKNDNLQHQITSETAPRGLASAGVATP